jgi:hypothetical protein
MPPGLRKVLLSAMLRGTYSGGFLAAIAFFATQERFLEGWAKSGWPWDQLLHYVFEGALAVGLANGIARLFAPSKWPWNSSPDNAVVPVGWRSRIGRWLVPFDEEPLAFAIVGVVYAGALSGGIRLGCGDWLVLFMGWGLCVFYLLGLVLLLAGAARRRLKPSSSVRNIELAGRGVLTGMGPMACPIVGYLLGTAVTLLPGASGWTFAPQYGLILAVAGGIVLDAGLKSLMPFGVKSGAEAERSDERMTNPV